MRNIYISVALLFTSALITAQKPVIVNEDTVKVSKYYVKGLSVSIPETQYEKILKEWTKLLQSNTKSKVAAQNGDISIFGARSKEIRPEPFNVYSTLMDMDSAVLLSAAFEFSKDVYADRVETPELFGKVRDYLKNFAVGQYTDVVKDQLDAEDRKLRELERELSKLENEHARLLKSIESNRQTIAEEKSSIINQNNELATVNSSLGEQNNLLASMEEGDAKKEKASFIKDLEKRKSKAESSVKNSERKISKSENEISEAQAALPVNEQSQDQARQNVTTQQIIYQKYVEKYKKVKSY